MKRDVIDQSQPSTNVTEVFRGNETVPRISLANSHHNKVFAKPLRMNFRRKF